MVDHLVSGTVEPRPEMGLRNGRPDRVRDTLAERPSRRLNADGHVAFRMARRSTTPLTKRFDVVQRQVVARQVEERIQEHGAVPGREHEAITVWPARIQRVVSETPGPQDIGHPGCPHRKSGMTRVGVLHGVDRQDTDCVDSEGVEFRRFHVPRPYRSASSGNLSQPRRGRHPLLPVAMT